MEKQRQQGIFKSLVNLLIHDHQVYYSFVIYTFCNFNPKIVYTILFLSISLQF